MTVLALKLLLAPGFIVATSLLSRRFGVGVAGVVAGLPAIAGPILLVLALDHDHGFVQGAATGVLLGIVALVVFVLAFAWVGLRAGWPWALAGGWGSFVAVIAALSPVDVGPIPALAVACTACACGLVLLPRPGTAAPQSVVHPPFDLLLRAVCAVVPVVSVTAAARVLGPHLSGLVAASLSARRRRRWRPCAGASSSSSPRRPCKSFRPAEDLQLTQPRVEEGDFTLGPMTSFALVAFDALTITSPAGTVTGSKTLAPDVAPVNTGACGPFSGFVPNAPDSFNLQVPTRYTATLPGGASDSGEAIVSYGDMQFRDLPDTNTFNFVQTFASDAFLGALGQKATGGGKVTPDVSFGFSPMRKGLKGSCNVVDHVLGVHVKCLDVTTYAQFDNQATFTGNASVDGVQTTYRIHVVDGGEPGNVIDTFSITTTSGYSASGSLTSGNVQVHSD